MMNYLEDWAKRLIESNADHVEVDGAELAKHLGKHCPTQCEKFRGMTSGRAVLSREDMGEIIDRQSNVSRRRRADMDNPPDGGTD